MAKFALELGMSGNAVFDSSGEYRYWLQRKWDDLKAKVSFIMLNPSVADSEWDDRAVQRCIFFARNWGFGSVEIVNLFAYQTESPKILKSVMEPIGKDNDKYILETLKNADIIIAAWGNDGAFRNRYKEILTLVQDYDLHCMGITAESQPKYPARLSNDTRYFIYRYCVNRK